MEVWRRVRGVNLFSYGDYPACCDLSSHCLRGYLGSFKTELVGIYSDALKTMVYPGGPQCSGAHWLEICGAHAGAGRYLRAGHPVRLKLKQLGQLDPSHKCYVVQDRPPPRRLTHAQVKPNAAASLVC